MARTFAPISISELEAKIDKAFVEDDPKNPYCNKSDAFSTHVMLEKLGKDLKVSFDFENFEMGGKELMGYTTLSNGFTFCGMSAGGDWEYPVFFVVYWDGKKLRGYVPTEGNPWNTDTKTAYGNDEDADGYNAHKRWPDLFDGGPVDSGDFATVFSEIEQDIRERILPITPPAPKTKKAVSRTGKKTTQERIEACVYYGTGDEGYELFQATCSYCYQLTGLGQSDKAEIVCQWAEEMAKESKDWAKAEGFLDDNAKGYWGHG